MFNIYVAVLGPVGTNCYIIINEETKESAIIDAAASADRLIRAATKDGTDLKCLLLTHAHWDHMGGISLFPNARRSGESWLPLMTNT